eukprot:1133943-Pelagomonas_calceolata.AAC.3
MKVVSTGPCGAQRGTAHTLAMRGVRGCESRLTDCRLDTCMFHILYFYLYKNTRLKATTATAAAATQHGGRLCCTCGVTQSDHSCSPTTNLLRLSMCGAIHLFFPPTLSLRPQTSCKMGNSCIGNAAKQAFIMWGSVVDDRLAPVPC